MNTERMIRQLRHLEEKHKDDNVFTFETNWSLMCRDVANRLEEYENLMQDILAFIAENSVLPRGADKQPLADFLERYYQLNN